MKQGSIIHYIVVIPAIGLITMAIIILVVIRLLSNAAIDSEIKRSLVRNIRLNQHNVSVESGELEISEDFYEQSDSIYFLILSLDGQVLRGKYPDEIAEELAEYQVDTALSRSIVLNGMKYYIRDSRVGKYKGKEIFLRGIIKKSDADSFYRSIEIIAYISMSCVLFLMFICEMILAKRISKELKNMCNTAESIGSNLDLSQRMECEDQLYEIATLAQANNRMLDQMEEMLKLQEQFTSDVAHELRTPVAVVLAQCEYVTGKKLSEAETQEFIEVVYRQSGKMDMLIVQLLKLSRLDQDRMKLQYETLDLVEIVQSVCEEQQDKAVDKVTINLNLKEVFSRGDINLISIVILNLLTNAVKFSNPGGQIDVSTGEEGEWVYISVRDYGIGIDPEDLDHIFRRFYKCDKSRNAEGFGLGLPLSEKIAVKHGGKITVSSKKEKGSKFTLYLPNVQP